MEPPAESTTEPNEVSLIGHLEELRHRILVCIFAFMIFFFIAYSKSDALVKYLIYPLNKINPDLKLSALSITEGFLTTLKLAGYAALAATLPIILWQAWRFVEPGLLPKESFWFRLLFVPMLIAFLGGCTFCYFIALPFALQFFLSNLGENFTPVFSYAAYMDFSLLFIFLMGIIFESPLFMALLDGMGILPVEWVKTHRRHTVVVAFIIGAIMSPPDVVSQMFVSVSFILLIEFGIWLSLTLRKVRKVPISSE